MTGVTGVPPNRSSGYKGNNMPSAHLQYTTATGETQIEQDMAPSVTSRLQTENGITQHRLLSFSKCYLAKRNRGTYRKHKSRRATPVHAIKPTHRLPATGGSIYPQIRQPLKQHLIGCDRQLANAFSRGVVHGIGHGCRKAHQPHFTDSFCTIRI